MYELELIIALSALALFWLDYVRPALDFFVAHPMRYLWNKKPLNCAGCLSMWLSVGAFLLTGSLLVFAIYLIVIKLDK